MGYSPAVTAAFLTNVAACTSNGTGLVHAGMVLYPAIIRGTWQLATVGDTITSTVYTVLCGSTANADGSYTTAAGAVHVLVANAGAVVDEPGPPPPR